MQKGGYVQNNAIMDMKGFSYHLIEKCRNKIYQND